MQRCVREAGAVYGRHSIYLILILNPTQCALLCNLFSVCVLVGVRAPQHLRLTRTYTNAELKAPAESSDVNITGMCVSADGGLILVDCNNDTVKELDTASGSLCSLYKETDRAWRVSNACLAAHTDGTQSLLITENFRDGFSKRVVVAQRSGAAAIFTRTSAIVWKDYIYVRVWSGCMRASHPPPTRPPLSASISGATNTPPPIAARISCYDLPCYLPRPSTTLRG